MALHVEVKFIGHIHQHAFHFLMLGLAANLIMIVSLETSVGKLIKEMRLSVSKNTQLQILLISSGIIKNFQKKTRNQFIIMDNIVNQELQSESLQIRIRLNVWHLMQLKHQLMKQLFRKNLMLAKQTALQLATIIKEMPNNLNYFANAH